MVGRKDESVHVEMRTMITTVHKIRNQDTITNNLTGNHHVNMESNAVTYINVNFITLHHIRNKEKFHRANQNNQIITIKTPEIKNQYVGTVKNQVIMRVSANRKSNQKSQTNQLIHHQYIIQHNNQIIHDN